MNVLVEIPDDLLREAKEYAARNDIPLREVLARGLRSLLQGGPSRSSHFKLKCVTTKGEGRMSGKSWRTARILIYQKQGG